MEIYVLDVWRLICFTFSQKKFWAPFIHYYVGFFIWYGENFYAETEFLIVVEAFFTRDGFYIKISKFNQRREKLIWVFWESNLAKSKRNSDFFMLPGSRLWFYDQTVATNSWYFQNAANKTGHFQTAATKFRCIQTLRTEGNMPVTGATEGKLDATGATEGKLDATGATKGSSPRPARPKES